MKNQRGEIVTGVMVVMMVGMMIFGMVFMHGGHGDRHDHESAEHKEGHTAEQAPVPATEETK